MSATLQPLIACDSGFFFLYVCWWCYYWSDWGLGDDLLCVVDVLAGGQGGVRGQDLSQRSGC